jgi:acyl dehydratase
MASDTSVSDKRPIRWFEDYPAGAVFDLGSTTVSAEDIIGFAKQYDPQSMHVDPDWSARGPFGEVIASGWHTIAVMMRLFVDRFLPENGLASPGIDEIRWLRPVRPGDELHVKVTILDARPSRSKPDRGLLHSLVEVSNQNGEVVLTMKPMNLMLLRPGPAAASG